MMRQIISVGALAASNASNIATTQKATTGVPLTLDGTLTDAVAASVAASQTPGGAGNLVLTGGSAFNANANNGAGAVMLGLPRRLIFNDAANDSGITFTIVGKGIPGAGLIPGSTVSGAGLSSFGALPMGLFGGGPMMGQTEVVTGGNASKTSSKNLYFEVDSIAVSGAGAGTVVVGTQGFATLDLPRQIGIASAGNDTGVNFTIIGLDWAGLLISEVLAGASAATAVSVLSYSKVLSIVPSAASASTLTVGTTGVAYSSWINFDPFAGMGPTAFQINGSGTVNWTVQTTMDDPNSITNPVAPNLMTWVNSDDPRLVGSTVTTGVQGSFNVPPTYVRILLNSGSGKVTGTFNQIYTG